VKWPVEPFEDPLDVGPARGDGQVGQADRVETGPAVREAGRRGAVDEPGVPAVVGQGLRAGPLAEDFGQCPGVGGPVGPVDRAEADDPVEGVDRLGVPAEPGLAERQVQPGVDVGRVVGRQAGERRRPGSSGFRKR